MIFSSHNVRVRVAGIVTGSKGILLIAHKKDGDVYWLLPGGGVDFGESLEDALVREFKEELNIAVELGPLALVFDSIDPSGDRHIINICFHCTCAGGSLQLGKEKRLYDYSFFNKDEIQSLPMYPPLNDSIISIMNNELSDLYQGRLWLQKESSM